MDPLDKLIVALDVVRMESALNLVDALDRVKAFKIGPQLFLRDGELVAKFVKSRGAEIFVDLKLHDIQKVVVETAKAMNDFGVDYLTIHADVGQKILEAAVQAAPNVKIIVVVALTNESLDFYKNYEPRNRAALAKACGAAGCVTPGGYIVDVKMRFPKGIVVVPGIRLTVEDDVDQVSVTTPDHAIRFGADKLIVGRPIYRSSDPNKALDEILKNIQLGEEYKRIPQYYLNDKNVVVDCEFIKDVIA